MSTIPAMVALDAAAVSAQQATPAEVAIQIATTIRLGDVEMTRSVLERLGHAINEWESHSEIVRVGIATLTEALQGDAGDATERVYELALMAASLSPALRSACRHELKDLATSVPDDLLAPLLDAPSPHVRIGARLLAGWTQDSPILEEPAGSRQASVAPATEGDIWSPDRSPLLEPAAVGEEPPPWPASVEGIAAFDDLQQILADLCHPAVSVRRAAIGRCSGRAFTASLADALLGVAMLDTSPDVRVEAMRAFTGQTQSVRLLAAGRALSTSDPDVQLAGVDLLGGRSDDDVALLVEFAGCGNASAAARAVDLLAQLPPSEAMALLWTTLPRAATGTQQAIVGRLREIDERALRLNVRLARGSRGTGQRTAALIALGVLDDEPIAPLVESLSDPDAETRHVALRSLARRRDPDAAEAVGRRLSDPRPEIRALSLAILRDTCGIRATPWLIVASGDPVESVRRTAIESIRAMDAPEVVGEIVRALRTPAMEQAASRLLVELGDSATEAVVDAIPGAAPRTVKVIGEILWASGSAPTIAKMLLDPDPQRRRAAAEAAAAMRAGDVVDTLMGLMQDPEPDVRCRAAELLGGIGDGTANDRLAKACSQEPDPRVVAAIESALGRLARPRDGFDELRVVDSERRAS